MYTARVSTDRMARIRTTDRGLRLKPTALTVFAFLTLAAATGCSDALAPAARALRVPPVVRDIQPLPPVSQSLPSTPLTRVFLASYPYVEGVLVEGRIQGVIHVTSDPQASCVHVPDNDVDYLGVWIFCSGGQCAWSAGISAAQGTTPSLLACSSRNQNPPYYTSSQEWRDTALVGGIGGNDTVRAVRGGGSLDPTYCGANLCHQTSGANTVTLTPLPAAINLTTPGNTQIAPKTILLPDPYNGTTNFVVAALPVAYHGTTVPTQALSWKWIPALSDSAVTAQCPSPPSGSHSNSCAVTLFEPGSMTVQARVNGVVQTDAIKVVGPQVKITLNKTSMRPSVKSYAGVLAAAVHDETQSIQVSVVDTSGLPIPNRYVHLG
jgi:hypothetical protein